MCLPVNRHRDHTGMATRWEHVCCLCLTGVDQSSESLNNRKLQTTRFHHIKSNFQNDCNFLMFVFLLCEKYQVRRK